MPRSVCIFQQFMPPDPSGAGKQALTLAQLLRDAGWSVIILTEDQRGEGPDGEIDGFLVRRIPPLVADPSMPQVFAYWSRVARELASLRARFDILHVHSVHLYQLGAVPAARLLGKRVLVRSSIVGDFAGLRNRRSGFARRWLLGFADAFVVLSERVAAEYASGGLPPGKLNLIPNGVDTDTYHPVTPQARSAIRAELCLPDHGRILIYHGVFIERKALHWAIAVLEPLLGELDITLLLVGGPAREEPQTGYAARLMEQIARSPARDRIIVRPFADDVHRYLQAADAYILPSLGEGMSNALLEAMAVGLVPFVTRTSGSEDVITDGATGFLFDAGDAEALTRRFAAAMGPADASALAAIGAAAAKRIQDRFSIPVTGGQYISLYEKLSESA